MPPHWPQRRVCGLNYHHNHEAAERTLAELTTAGGQGEILQFDVASENQVEHSVKRIVDLRSKIDILVNNAGVTSDGLLMRLKSEDWDHVVGTNLKGTVLCTKAVSRSMIRRRYGRIVNLSSVVAQMGNAGQSLYAATKAGILGFTRAMAREVASRGITVNAVAPGFIETEMTGKLSAELRGNFLQSIPLGRFGTCAEVADLVAFLAGAVGRLHHRTGCQYQRRTLHVSNAGERDGKRLQYATGRHINGALSVRKC